MHDNELIEARRYLSYAGIWPGPKQLDVERWLDNFDTESDRAIAMALLESYVHINEEQIAYAVCSTIRNVSTRPEFGVGADRRANWADFVASLVVSFPLANAGDSTASGYIFARIASQFGFPEDRIADTEHLIIRLAKKSDSYPVIFLDDLAASGTQFSRNWKRKHPTDHGRLSLADHHAAGKISAAYYLPIVSTVAAKAKIETECGITVEPTYLLDDDYGALANDTRLVPAGLRSELAAFVEKYSARTGKDEFGAAGYGGLGLALSFHHGSPNNTLPVLQWGTALPNWNPLVIERI